MLVSKKVGHLFHLVLRFIRSACCRYRNKYFSESSSLFLVSELNKLVLVLVKFKDQFHYYFYYVINYNCLACPFL